MASQNGHTETVKALAQLGANLNTCMHHHGSSPLLVASFQGHAGVVAALLAHHADPSIATTQEHLGVPAGSTPLSVAQAKGHADVVRVLNGELRYCYAAKCAKPGRRSCNRCKRAWYFGR